MDKIKIVSKIIQECAEHGHPLSAGQIDIILEALKLNEYEKDCVAGELLAWRTAKQAGQALEQLYPFGYDGGEI